MQLTRQARTRPCVLVLGTLLAALMLWQCGSGHGPTDTGTLSMNLAANVGSVTYRLRDAVFALSGPETLELGTEGSEGSTDDGETTNDGSGCSGAGCGDVLTAPLLVGSYQITLRDGWRLERDAGAGFQNVAARLASANPVGFFINGGETTRVVFSFEAEGRVITLDRGTLELSIEVEERDQLPVFDATACDFEDLQGCEALACETACPATDGGSCRVRCQAILDCVSEESELGSCLPTADDPMCGLRTRAVPDACTVFVEPAGGVNAPAPAPGATPLPAFVARELLLCLCSTPRP